MFTRTIIACDGTLWLQGCTGGVDGDAVCTYVKSFAFKRTRLLDLRMRAHLRVKSANVAFARRTHAQLMDALAAAEHAVIQHSSDDEVAEMAATAAGVGAAAASAGAAAPRPSMRRIYVRARAVHWHARLRQGDAARPRPRGRRIRHARCRQPVLPRA